MLINVDNNEIAKMVSNHVKDEVRKRIKEMQGDYTSKGFIENIIRDTVWDKIHELCPDVEDYLRNETIRCIDYAMSGVSKISKQQLVSEVIDGLFEKIERDHY